MPVDLVCYMIIQGSTMNLDHLCGRNNPNAPGSYTPQYTVAENQLLQSYRQMALLENKSIVGRLLNNVQNRPDVILREARNVCLPSNEHFREVAYRARFNRYRSMRDGQFLVIHNRLVYVLATKYFC